jgi:hypothetical protein
MGKHMETDFGLEAYQPMFVNELSDVMFVNELSDVIV